MAARISVALASPTRAELLEVIGSGIQPFSSTSRCQLSGQGHHINGFSAAAEQDSQEFLIAQRLRAPCQQLFSRAVVRRNLLNVRRGSCSEGEVGINDGDGHDVEDAAVSV